VRAPPLASFAIEPASAPHPNFPRVRPNLPAPHPIGAVEGRVLAAMDPPPVEGSGRRASDRGGKGRGASRLGMKMMRSPMLSSSPASSPAPPSIATPPSVSDPSVSTASSAMSFSSLL